MSGGWEDGKGDTVRSDRHYKNGEARHAEAGLSKRQKLLIYVVTSVIALAAVTVGVRAAMGALGSKKVFESEVTLKEELPEPDEFVQKFGESERANFLLIGSADGLTDTLMVASYDMKNQHVDLISVPRDTYYPRSGYSGSWSKINSIYHSKKGGVSNLAKAVSDVLDGMPIHYYMLIDYKGVANIVDAIGGVRFNVPFYMKYDDTTKGKELHVDIPGGEQTLTKKNVVQFLRFRQTNPWYKRQGYKDYGSMDVGRMETHQAFMKAAFKQAIGPNFPKVVSAVMENVESDLDMEMVWKLVTKAGGLTEQDITSYTLPGDSKMREGTSVWLLDEQGVEDLLKEIYNGPQSTGGQDGTVTGGEAD